MSSRSRNNQQSYQMPSLILGSRYISGVTPGSGLVVTDEMKQILGQPGFIKSDEDGDRMRALYATHSLGFSHYELSLFGLGCYVGCVEGIQRMFDLGMQPDLNGTDTAYELSYATLVIWGSHRIKPSKIHRHLDLLRLLISYNIPLDISDICGLTVVHHIVVNPNPESRYPEFLRLVLEAGANPNTQDRYGMVPLFPAIQQKFIPAIELLMKFGASLDIAEVGGLTAREYFVIMGPQVVAAVQKWVRQRSSEEAPMQDKQCDGCRKTDIPLKNCARCMVARYCSRKCQTGAWPFHKKICNTFSQSTTITVRPFYTTGKRLVLFSTSDLIRESHGAVPTPPIISKKRVKPLQYPKHVVIKVQTPLSLPGPLGTGSDMVIFTKKQDLVCQVRRIDNPEAFDILQSVVASKGLFGMKAYFSATLKSEDEMVIKISEVLAEQPF